MAFRLDEIDVRLLEELQRDASRSNAELARSIGLSAPATFNRVRRLREQGVLTGVHARLDPARLGLPLRVFVQLTLGRHTDAAEARLTQVVEALPQVVSADWVAGETDALLSVVARDLEELQRVLVALSSKGGAQRVVTLLRLKALKAPGPLPVAPAG